MAALLCVGSVPLAASASGVVVLQPRGGTWQYDVEAHGACAGFESPGYMGPCAFSPGSAPFGNLPGFCNGVVPDPVTGWPADTDLLAFVEIDVPIGAGSLHFEYDVDNNIEVALDGAPIFTGAYGDCALHGFADVPASPGPHKLAVRAIDLGGASYFDMSVTTRVDRPACPPFPKNVEVCHVAGKAFLELAGRE
jgi:hypothetical protein